MTHMDQLVTVLATCLSILALWAFFRWPYRRYRLDRFRDEIFEIRGQLFLLAAQGSLSFDHPAYGNLRQTLNGFIRFGNRLSLSSFVTFAFFTDEQSPHRQYGRRARAQWEKAVSSLEQPVKDQVLDLESAMHVALLRHLFLSVPLVVLYVFFLALPVTAAAVTAHLLQLLKPWFGKLDSAAWTAGQDSLASS